MLFNPLITQAYPWWLNVEGHVCVTRRSTLNPSSAKHYKDGAVLIVKAWRSFQERCKTRTGMSREARETPQEARRKAGSLDGYNGDQLQNGYMICTTSHILHSGPQLIANRTKIGDAPGIPGLWLQEATGKIRRLEVDVCEQPRLHRG